MTRRWFASLGQLVLFRIRTFYREPKVLFWVFVFPVLATGAFGLVFQPGDPEPLVVGVVGQVPLAASPELAIRSFALEADADRALSRGEISLVVIAGEPPRYRFDRTRQDGFYARALVDAGLQGPRDAVRKVLDPVSAPGRRYIDFVVPGLIGLELMNTTLLGVGLSLVEMRARKNLKRFGATPISRTALLLAQVVSRLSFTWVMAACTFAFAYATFGVRIQGSLLDVAALVLLGGASFAGISLAIASRQTSMEAAQGIVTVIAVPMVFLSGVFFSGSGFPISTRGLPAWLQLVASFLPLTAFNDTLRAICNDGERLVTRPRELAILVAWGLVPAVVAIKRFRWV